MRWILLLLLMTPLPARAGEPEERPAQPVEPLVVGETFTFPSTVLGEQRRINVYAPAAYDANPDERYPVLYMPDGGVGEDFLHIAGLVQILSLNGAMRPFLLVGIENTERSRDLTGPTSNDQDREMAPRIGGASRFRAFIGDELMPRIDSIYRTSGETAIVGESLAGLFVVETLLTAPRMFDIYLAIDPSLWWDDERLVETAVDSLREHPGTTAALYLAASGQEGIVEPTARLAALLEDRFPGLEVDYAAFPNETHGTVFHPAALKGFRTVLGPRNRD
jgi:uncharacterized protein